MRTVSRIVSTDKENLQRKKPQRESIFDRLDNSQKEEFRVVV